MTRVISDESRVQQIPCVAHLADDDGFYSGKILRRIQ